MRDLIEYEGGDILANLEDRTITGLLIPFNELGHTNAGRFMVEAGAIALPSDPSVITLNTDHERSQPVGRGSRVWEEPSVGIMATFAIARTPVADVSPRERVALLLGLTALRPGVEGMVLVSPDRHGGHPAEWWELAESFADRGFAMLVVAGEAAAIVLEGRAPRADAAAGTGTAAEELDDLVAGSGGETPAALDSDLVDDSEAEPATATAGDVAADPAARDGSAPASAAEPAPEPAPAPTTDPAPARSGEHDPIPESADPDPTPEPDDRDEPDGDR